MDDISSPISDSSDFNTFLIIEELKSLEGEELNKRLMEFDEHELDRINEMYQELIDETRKRIEEKRKRIKELENKMRKSNKLSST